MIEINNLSRSYKIPHGIESALCGINLSIQDKGLFCICGKSGSGKSTLLNIIGLFDKASAGEVVINGENILEYSEKQRNYYRQFICSKISQDYDLAVAMTVFDNCAMALSLRALNKSEVEEAVNSALKRVGLDGYGKRKVNSLSGGERQRVAIARSIALKSQILLCDEPTGNLDPEMSREIMDILKELSGELCVIVVTHNRMLADDYADRIIEISDGKIVSDTNITVVNGTKTGITEKDLQKYKRRVPVKYIFKFALLNATSKKLLSAVILILTVGLICILLTTTYMSDYSLGKTVAETMNKQGIYSVPLTEYSVDTDGGQPTITTYSYGIKPGDAFDALTEKYPDFSFADIYTFSRTFYDFSDSTCLEYNAYNCISFTDFIVVDDFSKLEYPLLIGRMPENQGEVVIFDYMAYNVIESGAFDEIATFDDLLGFTFENKTTGFKMKICGVLKSNYADFRDMDRSTSGFFQSNDYYFANSCLSVYRCVFGGREFAEMIKKDYRYISAESVLYELRLSDKKNDRITFTGNNTIRWSVESAERAKELGIDIVFDTDLGSGLYIRDTKLAEILGVSVSDLTDGYLNTVFPTLEKNLNVSYEYTLYSAYRLEYFALYYNTDYSVSGVFHSDSDNAPSGIIMDSQYSNTDADSELYVGKALLLKKSASENAGILNYLLPQSVEDSTGGAYAYTYFEQIANDTDDLLCIMNGIYRDYGWILLAMLTVSVFAYAVASVKKNSRIIGIFRSIGASQTTVIAIYSALTLVLTVTAFALAIPFSAFLTMRINMILSDEIGGIVVFYSPVAKSILTALSVTLGSLVLALSAVYIWMNVRKPISLIQERKD